MRYAAIYYGRKVRRISLFVIKFIDYLLLYLVAARQLYLFGQLFFLCLICWIIGAIIALSRRKWRHGTLKDRPKSAESLYPNHDRRENLILLTCIVILIAELYLIHLPLPV